MITIVQLLTVPIFFLLSYFILLVTKHNQYLVQIENNIISLRNMQAIADRLDADMKYVDPSQVPVDCYIPYYVTIGIIVGFIIVAFFLPVLTTTAKTTVVYSAGCQACDKMSCILMKSDIPHEMANNIIECGTREIVGPNIGYSAAIFFRDVTTGSSWIITKVLKTTGSFGVEIVGVIDNSLIVDILTESQMKNLILINNEIRDIVLALL